MSETKPRVAIATGAPGGIGRAMVRGLLAVGMRVAGVDRDRDPLEALAAAVREQGKAVALHTLQTDLTLDSAADEIGGATRARRAHRQAELAKGLVPNITGNGPQMPLTARRFSQGRGCSKRASFAAMAPI